MLTNKAGFVTVHLGRGKPPFHEQAFELVNQALVPGGFNEIHRRRNPAVLKPGFAIKHPFTMKALITVPSAA
jgi:hypothetical protein